MGEVKYFVLRKIVKFEVIWCVKEVTGYRVVLQKNIWETLNIAKSSDNKTKTDRKKDKNKQKENILDRNGQKITETDKNG